MSSADNHTLETANGESLPVLSVGGKDIYDGFTDNICCTGLAACGGGGSNEAIIGGNSDRSGKYEVNNVINKHSNLLKMAGDHQYGDVLEGLGNYVAQEYYEDRENHENHEEGGNRENHKVEVGTANETVEAAVVLGGNDIGKEKTLPFVSCPGVVLSLHENVVQGSR